MKLRSSIFAIIATTSFAFATTTPVGPDKKEKKENKKEVKKSETEKKDAEMTDAEVLKAYNIDPAILKAPKKVKKHHGAL